MLYRVKYTADVEGPDPQAAIIAAIERSAKAGELFRVTETMEDGGPFSVITKAPTRAVVPVGILERAAKLCDDLADEIGARSHSDATIQTCDEINDLARGLYAAARGETVDWSDRVIDRTPA